MIKIHKYLKTQKGGNCGCGQTGGGEGCGCDQSGGKRRTRKNKNKKMKGGESDFTGKDGLEELDEETGEETGEPQEDVQPVE